VYLDSIGKGKWNLGLGIRVGYLQLRRMAQRSTSGLLVLTALIWFPLATGFPEEVVNEIYLLVRERELMAFSALGDRRVSQDLRPSEKVLGSQYNGHVAVVVTQYRALGFSAFTNRWGEEKLMVDEVMVGIEAEGNVGTVITNIRALGFSARTGRWVVRRFRPK
jgi:hypothetical protein